MNQTKFTSSDSTMAITSAASQTFDYLLNQIKNSNLNFHLQQSPFSAIISLKKSAIKDINGSFVMPTILENKTQNQKLAEENSRFRETVAILESKVTKS